MSAAMAAPPQPSVLCPYWPAPPPDVSNLAANRGGQLVAGSIVLLVLPTVAVVLRLLSRWMARARLWWDDYTIVAALFFSWGPNIINLVSAAQGYGKHINTVSCAQLSTIFKLLYAFMIIYYLALGLVKASIILFQYRIFPIVHFRRILFGCNVFVACWLVACLLTAIFQCTTPSYFWSRLDDSAHCLDIVLYIRVSGAINTATNFILLAMPIPLLWNLRVGKAQKMILTLIFTIGLVVCAVSIVRLALMVQSDTYHDFTYSYSLVSIWTAAEPSITVVSACLPSLRPLFALLCSGRSRGSKGTSHTGSTRTTGLSHPWPRSRQASDADDKRGGGFNRLRDSSQGLAEGYTTWTNKFSAHGGHIAGVGEEYDIGASDAGDRNSMLLPATGIRVRTTVTVTEKVDYQDNLF